MKRSVVFEGALSGERLLDFAPVLEGDDHGAHAIALREHELLDAAVLELGEHGAEITHRLADRAQLVGADTDRRGVFVHDAEK